MLQHLVRRILLAALAALGGSQACAQSFPSKPLRLIVASGTGGGLDFVARLLAPRLADALGQPVVVDNRPGASGSIGVELAARAAPDGHTLVVLSASSVVHAAVYKVPYRLPEDFVPVMQTSAGPYLLVVNPGLPVRTARELIDHAKAHPGRLNYGSTGNASLAHLAGAHFGLLAGIDITHVPYKGLGAAYADLIAGQIQLSFGIISSGLVQVRAQRLRGLAVTGAQRAQAAPQIPTMVEAGVPGFIVTQWHGVLAPRGTPRGVIERLHREFAAALQNAEVVSRLAADGTETVASTPEQFAAHIRREHETWSAVIRRAGIRGD